ncbi:MAG: hypothetical protein JW864_17170 [Spirochaetes bacterium]|nr:hypothetical protein [Spirochaetota bacterium]
MKDIKLVIILFLTVILFACASSDDTDNNYEFIDQDLQGKIEGTDWTYQSGTAEISMSDSSLLSVRIYNIDPSGGDSCGTSPYLATDDIVMMSFPDETGVYSPGNQWSITLNHGFTNYVLLDGKFKILTIDTSGFVCFRL